MHRDLKLENVLLKSPVDSPDDKIDIKVSMAINASVAAYPMLYNDCMNGFHNMGLKFVLYLYQS